jgi:hypothetical protein
MADPIRDALERAARELELVAGSLTQAGWAAAASRARNEAHAARAALAAQPPAAATASDGEREEVARLLIADAECLEAEQPDLMVMTNQQMRRAATLLRNPAPAAVPVAVVDRPWEREGWSDAQGQCWMGDPGGGGFIPSWRLCRPEDAPRMTASLPCWAIPFPQPPQGGEVQS